MVEILWKGKEFNLNIFIICGSGEMLWFWGDDVVLLHCKKLVMKFKLSF